jgi:signal transduction histidine kinase
MTRRTFSRAPAIIAAVVVALSLLSTLSVYLRTEREARQARSDRLDDIASMIGDRFRASIEEGWSRVVSIQGLYEASQEVTEDEFLAFTRRLGAADGLASISLAPRVVDIPAFEEAVSLRHPGYRVTPADSVAPPTSGYFPILVQRLFGGVDSHMGFDLTSDPVRAEAISKALGLDAPSVSGFVRLPGDADPRDVEVVAPVRNEARELIGVAVAAVQLDEMLDGLVSRSLGDSAHWNLHEIEEDSAESLPLLREPTRWSDVIDVHGSQWLMRLSVAEGSQSTVQGGASELVLGIAVSLLLALLAYVIARSRVSTQQIRQLTEAAASKDRFLASVSHELRTPLTTVMGLASVLAADWHSFEAGDVQDYLDLLEREGTQLADLVDDLLIIERVATDTLHVAARTVDLSEEASAVTSRAAIPDGKRLELAPDLGHVRADPARVRQILRNLVANALRYAHSRVRIDGHEALGVVYLRVHNDGAPIDDERIESIFGAYEGSQATGQPQSLGTGLWLSSRLAKLMGGELAYAGGPEGSEFTLCLPAASTDLDEGAPKPAVSSSSRATKA